MTAIDQEQKGSAMSRSASYTSLLGVLSALREAVIVVDPSMRIAASNQSAYRAFGRENGSIDGRRLSEVIRDADLHGAFRRASESGSSSELKLEFVAKESRIYDTHIAPIEIERVRYAIGVFYDVTQIDRLERVRQEFLSNISHELRTPLTSILAYVETLEDGAIDDSENNRRFLNVIRRNAERMNALIADILELSFIESGNISIEVKQVRASSLVDDVFADLSTKASERGIELKNQIDPEVRVCADPMRLEQMLTNLVDNAIKFNRSAGTVTVSHDKQPGSDLLIITDTGEGILAAHASRIFERFYRVDRGRTREVGGTGLGLAIVKHLARLHGGEVSLKSELGLGTTFTIELPAAATILPKKHSRY
jgi:two-component system, OmpR family, phosphate regulon sensor histidine kinase PhoR